MRSLVEHANGGPHVCYLGKTVRLKGNPAVPEGSLTSKPTWSDTPRCPTTSAFFAFGGADQLPPLGTAREDCDQTPEESMNHFAAIS